MDASVTEPTEPHEPPIDPPVTSIDPPAAGTSSPPDSGSAGAPTTLGSAGAAGSATTGAAGAAMPPIAGSGIAGSSASPIDAGRPVCDPNHLEGIDVCADASMGPAGSPAPPPTVDAGGGTTGPGPGNQLLDLVAKLLESRGVDGAQVVAVLSSLSGRMITAPLVSAVLSTLEDAGLCTQNADAIDCRPVCALIQTNCQACAADPNAQAALQRICSQP
jgi:hypothetical protein